MKSTKRPLLLSLTSLLLCVSMLLGTTYSWFTDRVTSGASRIIAGNLDVGVKWAERYDGTWYDLDDPEHNVVFQESILWEPGHTQARYFKIENKGALALKYKLNIEPAGVIGSIADVLDVTYLGSVSAEQAAAMDARGAYGALPVVGPLSSVITGLHQPGQYSPGYDSNYPTAALEGVILPANTDPAQADAEYDRYIGETVCMVGLKMRETAGNEYMSASIGEGFYITCVATQYQYEEDSFGSDYDEEVGFPTIVLPQLASAPVTLDESGATTAEVTLDSGLEGGVAITATVPVGTQFDSGTTEAVLSVALVSQDGNISMGDTTISRTLDVHMAGVAAGNTKPIIITIPNALPTLQEPNAVTLYHTEGGVQNPMTQKSALSDVAAHNDYYYNSTTGTVTMALASFSEILFEVSTDIVKWDPTKTATAFSSGSGTEEDPYMINTAAELAYLAAQVNSGTEYANTYFKLGKDIVINDWDLTDADLTGTTYSKKQDYCALDFASSSTNDPAFEQKDKAFHTWTPIGDGSNEFSGTFDGNNHTISGLFKLHYDDPMDRAPMGLFGWVHDGTVKNLTVADSFIYTYGGTVGLVAAYASGSTKFENVKVKENFVTSYNYPLGGILGMAWQANEDGDAATIDDEITFNNVIVDNSNKLEALWGTYDSSVGGVVGTAYLNTDITMNDVTVYPEMSLYNDCCANYQWFAYRYSGMLIGYVRASDRASWLANNLHCSNVTVKYGEWTDQYYCERVELGKGSYNGAHEWKYERISKDQVLFDGNGNVIGCNAGHNHKAGKAYTYKGQTYYTTEEDEDNVAINIAFHQLFGGGQGVYGEDVKKYAEYCGKSVNDCGITELGPDQGVGSISIKFPNTGKYLYRVGNRNTITLGTLFQAENGTNVFSSGVTLRAQKITGVTEVHYTADSTTWTNGTLKFDGTGVIKLIIEYRGVATELNLEVVDAVNYPGGKVNNTNASMSATSNNVVLVDNVSAGSSSVTVSNGYALYGNGFRMTFTGNGAQGKANVTNYGTAYVNVNGGTLDNVQIRCAQYPQSTGSVPGDNPSQSGGSYPYIMPAVTARGDAVIQNCYIYGARVNVFSDGGNITLKDTVCECAATANIQLWSNDHYTVTLDNVTTIQYLYNNNKVYGFGVLNGHNESTSNAKILIENGLTQYNWVNSSTANSLGSDVAKKAIQEAVSKIAYQHSYNGTNYVNLGVAYLNNTTHEIVDHRANAADYSYSDLTISAGILGSYNGGVYSVKSGRGSVAFKDGSYVYNESANTVYEPQMRLKSDLGGQKIDYDPDADEYCYVDGGVLKVTFLAGSSKQLDLASMMSIAKYTGQDLSLVISCVEAGGAALPVTNGKVTLTEQKNYTITYTVTDAAVYDRDGNLTGASKAYTKTLPLEITLKDDSIPNAEFEFDQSDQRFYYTSSSSQYIYWLPVLNGLTVYDYDSKGNRYARFDADQKQANQIVKVEHTSDSSDASKTTTKFMLRDGGIIEIHYSGVPDSGPSDKSVSIVKTSDGVIWAKANGKTSGKAMYWEIYSYKFTGNNGTEIVKNGSVPYTKTPSQAMMDSATTEGNGSNYNSGRNVIMVFDENGNPDGGICFIGTSAVKCYKKTYSSSNYAYYYGRRAESKSLSGSSFTGTKTLIYNANGGSVNPEYATSSPATLPTPTRTGYRFLGWNTDKDGAGTSYNAGTSYSFSESTVLYAQWKKLVTYRVTYDADGGNVTSTYSEGYSGDAITLPTTTQSTQWFTGWYDGETRVGGAGGSYTIPERNVTLTAHWSPKYYVIYDMTNGGTVSTDSITNPLNGQTVYGAIYEGTAITLPTPTPGAQPTFEGWYTAASGGTKVGGAGDSYKPTANITLYAQWSTNVPVSFDANGGECGTSADSYDGVTPITLPAATRAGHAFNGWYTAASGGTKVGNAGASYTPTEPAKLFAQWAAYTVTYNANSGSVSPSSLSAGSDGSVTLPTPTRTGYTFNGWYTAASGGTKVGSAGESYTPTADITLYAQWTQQKFTVTIKAGSNGKVSPTSIANVPYGTTVTVSFNTLTINSTKVTATPNSNYSFDKWDINDGAIITSDKTITASFKSTCLTAGTLITMADGTLRPVELIAAGDMLLTWDLENGCFGAVPVVFNDADPETEYEIIHAYFDNGSDVEIISEHGFFDMELGRYVYFDADAAQYIGHSFAVADGDSLNVARLTNVVIERRVTTPYSPVTFGDLCYFTDGVLSMPGGISGLFNIFDVDVGTMRYDAEAMRQDIESYGLLTIEDFGDMITQDMFDAFNGQYLGVAVGKQNITWEQIAYLAERYAPLCD